MANSVSGKCDSYCCSGIRLGRDSQATLLERYSGGLVRSRNSIHLVTGLVAGLAIELAVGVVIGIVASLMARLMAGIVTGMVTGLGGGGQIHW